MYHNLTILSLSLLFSFSLYSQTELGIGITLSTDGTGVGTGPFVKGRFKLFNRLFLSPDVTFNFIDNEIASVRERALVINEILQGLIILISLKILKSRKVDLTILLD